jgi:hypothetical protein
MGAASVLAPLKSDATDDHQIAINDRRDGATAVRREQSEIFAERSFPQNFSIAIETDQVAADPEGVDVSSRSISDR